jgi:hypothetical protein
MSRTYCTRVIRCFGSLDAESYEEAANARLSPRKRPHSNVTLPAKRTTEKRYRAHTRRNGRTLDSTATRGGNRSSVRPGIAAVATLRGEVPCLELEVFPPSVQRMCYRPFNPFIFSELN